MTVIEFPSLKFLVWCGECNSTEFEIYLNSADPHDINSLECGDLFLPEDSVLRKPMVKK